MDGARSPLTPTPGRGAPSNHKSARVPGADRVADGDWRDDVNHVDGPLPKLRTQVTVEHPRTIIARNTSPDIGFDRSINPYRGCEHGCVYCYARPTHAWLDLSPGLDFETRLFAKPDAANLLRTELAKPGYRVAPLAIGTNTDGYQPIEREWKITRSVLEVLLETRHPLILTTKSDRLLRDIDILAEMARHRLVFVAISLTSLDSALSGRLEPRAVAPAKRLRAVSALAEAGVPVQVNFSPVIPAINDAELERVMQAAADAGARRASMIPLRLPHEVAPLFREWLNTHFPERAAKVMAIVRSMRGGKDNDPQFGTRMRGTGVWADLVRDRFRLAIRRYGLTAAVPALDASQFLPPPPDGQLRLI